MDVLHHPHANASGFLRFLASMEAFYAMQGNQREKHLKLAAYFQIVSVLILYENQEEEGGCNSGGSVDGDE